VQVTSVVPTGKRVPEAGSHLTGTLPSTRSLALAAKETTAPSLESATTLIPCGSCSAGGVVSRTSTVNEPCATPAPLRAAHVTMLAPSGKMPPEAGRQKTATPPPSS